MTPVTINQFTQPITLGPSTVDLLKQCLCMDVYIQGRGRTSSRLASDIFVSTGCTGVVPRRAIARNRSLVILSSDIIKRLSSISVITKKKVAKRMGRLRRPYGPLNGVLLFYSFSGYTGSIGHRTFRHSRDGRIDASTVQVTRCGAL